MRRLVILGSILALLLGALYFMTRDDGDRTAPAVEQTAESSPTRSTTARPVPGQLPANSLGERGKSPPTTSDEPAPVQWQEVDLSKRVYVQREDDSVPWPKNAPPPLFKKETLQAIRAAVTPGVSQCMEKTKARYPELVNNPELTGEISIAYTARAAGGGISISAADVVVQGFPDDDLASCVKEVYIRTHVTAAGQADGSGKVSGGFTLKK